MHIMHRMFRSKRNGGGQGTRAPSFGDLPEPETNTQGGSFMQSLMALTCLQCVITRNSLFDTDFSRTQKGRFLSRLAKECKAMFRVITVAFAKLLYNECGRIWPTSCVHTCQHAGSNQLSSTVGKLQEWHSSASQQNHGQTCRIQVFLISGWCLCGFSRQVDKHRSSFHSNIRTCGMACKSALLWPAPPSVPQLSHLNRHPRDKTKCTYITILKHHHIIPTS